MLWQKKISISSRITLGNWFARRASMNSSHRSVRGTKFYKKRGRKDGTYRWRSKNYLLISQASPHLSSSPNNQHPAIIWLANQSTRNQKIQFSPSLTYMYGWSWIKSRRSSTNTCIINSLRITHARSKALSYPVFTLLKTSLSVNDAGTTGCFHQPIQR